MKPLPRSAEIAAADSGRRRQRILQYLVTIGPTTIHEYCEACSYWSTTLHPHQVSGRFTDLSKEGLLATIGERAHPISGAACNVYAITDAGRAELLRMKTSRPRI